MAIQEMWMPSPHYSTSRGPYNKAVLHTTEGATTIEALGSWFANPSAGVSSHHGADNKKRSVFGAYVYENYKAWTQGSANPYCLSIELCTPAGAAAGWSQSYWLSSQDTLCRNAAEWLAYVCGKYSIPFTKLSSSQAQNPDIRGICQHMNLGSWGSNHSDCGSGFPIDQVIEWARGAPPPQPEPQPPEPVPAPSVTTSMSVLIPSGSDPAASPDVGLSLDKLTYTKVGFCCDPGRVGGGTVAVRVAWLGHRHRRDDPGAAEGGAVPDRAGGRAVVPAAR